VAPRLEMESTGRERHEEEEEKQWIEAHQQRKERARVTIIQMQGHPIQIWLKSTTILICTGSLDTCESNKSCCCCCCCCCAKAQPNTNNIKMAQIEDTKGGELKLK
jgi:hypothetical protein